MKKQIFKISIIVILAVSLSMTMFGCALFGAFGIGDVINIAENLKPFFRSNYTEEEKYYIGRSTCAYVFGKFNIDDKNTNLTAYINQIGQTVAMASEKATTFKGYRFVIIDDTHPNAYGTPGGMVIISKGMINLCENEDELAAVLAHEVGHVVLEHPIKAVSNATKQASLVNIAKIAAAKAAGEVIPPELTQGLVDGFGNVLKDVIKAFDNGYSKNTEFEADKKAIPIMHDAGYSVDALKSILNKLPQDENSKYGSNHPTSKDRISAIDKEIKNLKITPHPISPERTKRFKSIVGK